MQMDLQGVCGPPLHDACALHLNVGRELPDYGCNKPYVTPLTSTGDLVAAATAHLRDAIIVTWRAPNMQGMGTADVPRRFM